MGGVDKKYGACDGRSLIAISITPKKPSHKPKNPLYLPTIYTLDTKIAPLVYSRAYLLVYIVIVRLVWASICMTILVCFYYNMYSSASPPSALEYKYILYSVKRKIEALFAFFV